VDISEEIDRLSKKSQQLTKDVYANLLRDVHGRLALNVAQFVDLGFKFGDTALKLEEVFFTHQ
jgi:hypothetical protein